MRPVTRPDYTGMLYANYKSYLKPLITNFGGYCSYCEQEDKLDVEHVAPKSKNPHLIVDWDNLLLGCPRCNRDFKKSNNDNRNGYVWPDTDNTFKLLKYFEDGRVKAQSNLDNLTKDKVKNTIKLVCLDDSQQPQAPLNLTRRRKFKIAKLAKTKYLDEHQTLEEILLQAEDGHWSVWVTVFYDIDVVREALTTRQAYPNTVLERAM